MVPYQLNDPHRHVAIARSPSCARSIHDLASFAENRLKMRLISEALRVELVEILDP